MAKTKAQLIVGVDVGGTKIAAALVKRDGKIVARRKRKTPRHTSAKKTLEAITDTIDELLEKNKINPHKKNAQLRGIGLAVPGIIDDDAGKVVVAPNIKLAGIKLVDILKKKYSVPIALGNDVDLGTLGETWLGAAQKASSAIGIFVGTGIGGGIVINKKLWRGHRGFAGEVGHMLLDLNAEDHGFMAAGSLESLASRTAIERQLRAAMANGRTSALTKIMDDPTQLIKSGTLAKALAAEDKLTVEVMTEASKILGHAIVSLRRVFDPEMFILGGGVAEACGPFMLPIIRNIIKADPMNPKHQVGVVQLSKLGDDAGILGAAALVMQAAKR